MASGAEHYRRAEQLLEQTNDIDPENFATVAEFIAARQVTELGAQVHATLALAAATQPSLDPEYASAWQPETLVRITKRLHGHGFEIGQEVVLQHQGSTPEWWSAVADVPGPPSGWMIRTDEFEAVKS